MELYVGDTFDILLVENNQILYESEAEEFPKYATCEVRIRTSDGYCMHSFEGYSLSKGDIENIIDNINKTLSGDLDHNHQIRFEDPHVVGGGLFSPFSFHVFASENHEDDHWEFRYDSNGGYQKSGETHYSLGLCTDDLKELRTSLIKQLYELNWESHGKIVSYEIQLPDGEPEWCYSAKDMQTELDDICKGHTFVGLYINQEGYIYQREINDGIDFSYMGGKILIAFDSFAIELKIKGEGLFRYRIIENLDIEKCNQLYGYARNNLASDNMVPFCKLSEKSISNCVGRKIISCTVERTDMYPFNAVGVDRKKIGQAAVETDLPEKLRINMDNGRCLCFVGDDIEDFWIITEFSK